MPNQEADSSVSSVRPCIVLGVTGSIAAYKAADLTSKLVQAGCEVHVIMTGSATKLVQPQTFLTLSRQPVTVDLWNTPEWRPEHIELAARADVFVIAPATANIIAKLALGIADDALSTFALAHTGPVLLAPAMNPRMWRNPAVQHNCGILRGRGMIFVGPEQGSVACGPDGPGRMIGVAAILDTCLRKLANKASAALPTAGEIKKLRLLVTAGPTREAIDPVRFISNRSSGRMGYAVAAAAVTAGIDTTLISGPVALTPPSGCRLVQVTTAADMAEAVKSEFKACDVLVMCAAVADYRPVRIAGSKIKKKKATLKLALEPTEDILGALKDLKSEHQKIMGFAAETEDTVANAQDKLSRKNLDWIVANDVSRADAGFDVDTNQVTVISRTGTTELPLMSKKQVAEKLVSLITAESGI